MKSTSYFILSLLFVSLAWAQNDNRGRARPNYNPDNLTDAERRESESYIHEGLNQEVMLQECANLTPEEAELFQKDQAKAYQQFGDKLTEGMATCGGDKEVKGLGLSPEMAGAISKAYSMIIPMMGGGLKLTSLKDISAEKTAQTNQALDNAAGADGTKVADMSATERADAIKNSSDQSVKDAAAQENTAAEEAKDDERDQTDYCQFVAMGTEAIAMVQQTMAQQEMNTIPLEQENNAQKAALMRVSRGYKERAKNAQTQAMGWGVTTGCYTYMMFKPSVDKKAWQNWLKVGASGFLTTVFALQVKGFNNAAETTKNIANLLPGAGDCNPHTDRDCYCSQTTTMGDPKYCAPYAHQRSIRDPGVTMRTSCITDKAEADPKCACLQDDSCIHKGIDTLFSLDGLSGQINPAFAGDLKNLSTGTIAGSLNTDAINRNLSAARNAMRKANQELSKLSSPNPKLTPSQLKEAEFLESRGVPKTLAQAISAEKVTGNFNKTLALGGSRPAATSAAKEKSFNASIVDNSSSGGLNNKKAKKTQNAAANPFAKFMNKGGNGKSSSNGEILNFAQKAQAGAQISNRKDSSVFDIISRRYQVSAWRRLELE